VALNDASAPYTLSGSPPRRQAGREASITIQRIVVAGATGYIGSNVARACANAGFAVRILTRDPTRIPSNLKDAVEPFVG
jgi:NADPH-dependent 2,4-dienoyl-CoA reductase/sulfur reductase-like enzyme